MADLKTRLLRTLPDSLREPVRRTFGRARPWDAHFSLTPPLPPEGCVTGPPDFVGVAAQKAGTSWWYALVMAHPDTYRWPEAHKERHYFDRFWDSDFGPERVEEYHRWFPRPPGRVTGEWSPQYAFYHWVPRLLRRAAPETKILLMLRDPVERYCSGVTHFRSRAGERDVRLAGNAFYLGLYAEQLAALHEHFDRRQVLVLQYERCRREPLAEIRRTYEFLGLDPGHEPRTAKEVNVTRAAKIVLTEEERADLVRRYRPDVERLVGLSPELDLGLWPNFAHFA